MREPQNGDVVKIIHYTDHGRKGISIGMLEWVKKDDIGTYIKLSGHPPIFADSMIDWSILQ